MQISGKKMGSVKAVKDSLKKGGSSLNTYIKNVPAEGITVRFLTEPEEWFGFYEYWNDESRNFTPMAVGEILPDGAKQPIYGEVLPPTQKPKLRHNKGAILLSPTPVSSSRPPLPSSSAPRASPAQAPTH